MPCWVKEPATLGSVRGTPTGLDLSTLSTRLLGRIVVFVYRSDLDVADEDWRAYVQWLKELQAQLPQIGILITSGERTPSSAQRSWATRELNMDTFRIAVLLSDPKLVAIVRVSAWFMKGIAAFRPNEVEQALAFLGEPESGARVRAAISELGGVVDTDTATG